MMKETTVVNKFHKVPFDVYIGRGSKWGNPFSHLEKSKAQFKVDTREEAISKYKDWIMEQPQLLADLHELKGKILCCYCKPASCHGDILSDLADNLVWFDLLDILTITIFIIANTDLQSATKTQSTIQTVPWAILSIHTIEIQNPI